MSFWDEVWAIVLALALYDLFKEGLLGWLMTAVARDIDKGMAGVAREIEKEKRPGRLTCR